VLNRSLVVLFLFAVIGNARVARAADDAAAVTAAVEKLRVLMVDPDKAKLEALVVNDLSYGHSSGKVDTKASFVGDLVSGASDFTSVEQTDQTVKIVGSAAIVRHIFTGDMGAKGTVTLKVLQVWLKQGGKWKLLARQAVKVQ
jgi:hypothetical protein